MKTFKKTEKLSKAQSKNLKTLISLPKCISTVKQQSINDKGEAPPKAAKRYDNCIKNWTTTK